MTVPKIKSNTNWIITTALALIAAVGGFGVGFGALTNRVSNVESNIQEIKILQNAHQTTIQQLDKTLAVQSEILQRLETKNPGP